MSSREIDLEKVKAELDAIVDECRAFYYVRFAVVVEHCTNILALLKEQEPKMGKWILDDGDANSWECSECGGLLMINDGTPHENDWYFCPYCGAKLKEQEVKWND